MSAWSPAFLRGLCRLSNDLLRATVLARLGKPRAMILARQARPRLPPHDQGEFAAALAHSLQPLTRFSERSPPPRHTPARMIRTSRAWSGGTRGRGGRGEIALSLSRGAKRASRHQWRIEETWTLPPTSDSGVHRHGVAADLPPVRGDRAAAGDLSLIARMRSTPPKAAGGTSLDPIVRGGRRHSRRSGRQRRRPRPRRHGAYVLALVHDEARRNRRRSLGQPSDRRRARRPDLGRAQRRRWSELLLHNPTGQRRR